MTTKVQSASHLAAEVFRIPFEGPVQDIPSKEIVGSKAHNLMRLARRGLPVPPAFALSTEVCRAYLRDGSRALAGLGQILDTELDKLGTLTGRYFGDAKRPLLLSVRSGAAISMPGMMETILNVGLTDTTLRALIRMTGNPHLAYDCERRLMQQYGEVVHAIPPARFAARLKGVLDELHAADADELGTEGLKQLGAAFGETYQTATGVGFPADPRKQLTAAIDAVFRSWSSERAISYRKLNDIPDDLGTAVIVQTMVYGNLSPASGSGVGFTRSPADGTNELYIDYLSNAQGEDVVAGRRKAMGVAELQRRAPHAYRDLIAARPLLEQEFGDMQDFEFTVEEDRLYLLQARNGKRTPLAAARIACDQVDEGLITGAQALERLQTVDIDAIETVRLNVSDGETPLVRGTSASTGVAVGVVAFDPERVAALKRGGKHVILVRETAETSDIAAMSEADALVAAEGARTSHAAVVARQLGKVCVVGCEGIVIEASGRRAKFGAEMIEEGTVVSVDGAKGEIYRGAMEVITERPMDLIDEIASWRKEPAAPKKRAPSRRVARA